MTSAIEERVEKKEAAAVLTEDLSLGDLFAVVTGEEAEGDLKAGLDAKELSELRKKVPTAISWSSVQESVADSLAEAMHVSVLATLANGWKQTCEGAGAILRWRLCLRLRTTRSIPRCTRLWMCGWVGRRSMRLRLM